MPLSDRRSILCVDDDPVVLNILKRALETEFNVYTSESAQAAFEVMTATDEIHVVISDHRMPGGSGAQFLQRVRDFNPAITRILLTGETDLAEAVSAMNQAALFRFLLKPGNRNVLLDTIRAAIAHHDLQVAERELLQKTLVGSMSALSDVLAMANPVAFGRVSRIQEVSVQIAKRMGLSRLWPLEFASLASQLGHISLPDRTVRRLGAGEVLTGDELAQIAQSNAVAQRILKRIPRLEPVLEILENLFSSVPPEGKNDEGNLSADILRVASAYAAAEHATESREAALHRLRGSSVAFNPNVLKALIDLTGVDLDEDAAIEIPIEQIRVKMVVAEDLLTRQGVLLVPRGYRVTESFIAKLDNFKSDALPKAIRIKKNSS